MVHTKHNLKKQEQQTTNSKPDITETSPKCTRLHIKHQKIFRIVNADTVHLLMNNNTLIQSTGAKMVTKSMAVA